MATYNGEKYLREQVDSIISQTCQDWHLYIHDDGSKDSTIAIIKDYICQYPDSITLLDYPPQGGACKNFLSMLDKVEAPYYMFCDQDDVWLPEKIALSLEEMKRQEALHPQKPVVIHTDLHIVDDKLTVTYRKEPEHGPKQCPYDRPMFLLLDMQLGGHWVGQVKPEELPYRYQIDYVRFYKKKD